VELVRSQITIDLGALRRNVRRLREAAAPAELWAVVKADAYGHGVADVAPAALDAGAAALCVATVAEGASLRLLVPESRILVMGPIAPGEEPSARASSLEVAISTAHVPEGLRVHAKVDTGMGRWGMSGAEARTIPRERLAGVMSHLATADEADEGFVRGQLARFAELTASLDGVPRHLANSAATLRFPEARLESVRCGIALYGLSPFGDDPARHRLEPVLSWRSYVALVKTLGPGQSTGYGRRFVADRPTRIGLVPVGYADGWRRGLTGTEVLVAGSRRRVVGTISMDALAVELGDEPVGAPVTLVGDGVTMEEHARVLGTINYELACGVVSAAGRAERTVIRG
jgi:alanine racemase